MRLWRKSRRVPVLAFAGVATCLALLSPITVLRATPSPGGATVGLSVMVALGLPVLVGWSIARGDPMMERWSVRPVAKLDLLLVICVAALLGLAETALWWVAVAPAGLTAARATVTYFGLLLAALPFVGASSASIVPVAYAIAVVVFGRGVDADHPAAWAWIATLDQEPVPMVAAITMFLAGSVSYVRTVMSRRGPRRPRLSAQQAAQRS